ncbi:unnamed protein product [Didymodactylos carnosus]|uniref:Uncharacterized protein n=1 Tax=Didymodactylos carnosus TaxID=1234261 RepID=A0A815Y8H7_9BILA|nr:unnamed protein product [Didymodactylos carnosus]CAF4429327.1 unnamed protein product [Didymodactylos carnosus]
MDDGEFEIADDEDDESTNNLNMDDENNDSFSSNDDYSDEDDIQDSVDTTKQNFIGIKVFNTVESHMEHSYFKVTINQNIQHTKYIHKQTTCWLLTGEKSKLSNDRLLQVTQSNKEE